MAAVTFDALCREQRAESRQKRSDGDGNGCEKRIKQPPQNLVDKHSPTLASIETVPPKRTGQDTDTQTNAPQRTKRKREKTFNSRLTVN